MKWVLIVMMVGGGSVEPPEGAPAGTVLVDPVTSFDHVEFDDEGACEAVKVALEESDVPSRRFVDCFPKGTEPKASATPRQ